MQIVTYDFDNSFKDLSESIKEWVSLGKWSFYKIQDNQFFLVTDGGCPCCHGGREKEFFIIDDKGSFIKTESKDFYIELMKKENQNKISEIIKFKLPKRITKNYLKIRI